MIRLLTLIAALPLRIWVLIQRTRGKISSEVADNRLGRATAAKPDRPVIWVHAASLGELSAVRPFLQHLVKTGSGQTLLITTSNPKALEVAATWHGIPAILQTAPLDIPSVVNRFLNHWQPTAFVNIETEVWPNRFQALSKRGIPSIGLNARMSERSAKHFAKMGPAVGLQHFTAIFAQNTASANNYRTILGPEARIEVIPNFKSLVHLPAPAPKLVAQFDRRKTILAASTHPGEDEMILAAFSELAAQDSTLTLILAPRHPNRAVDILGMARASGFHPKPLGSGKPTNVYMVNTLGQLPHLYALASVTFIGGSLVPNIGGHTPYEPIRANSAIVTGPNMGNFTAEFDLLSTTQACIVATERTLENALGTALDTSDSLTLRARKALPPIDDPLPLMETINATLDAKP